MNSFKAMDDDFITFSKTTCPKEGGAHQGLPLSTPRSVHSHCGALSPHGGPA